MTQNPIYLFDGMCVFCSRGVGYVLKYEKEPDVRFVAIQSQEGRKLAIENDVDPEEPHTFIFVKSGEIYTLSTAVIRLARHVGGWARWFTWMEIVPRRVRDWLYLRIALNRYALFGKLEVCYVPPPDERHRFVLPEA